MKEFKDLEFVDHPVGNGKWATMNFENGFGVSVVFGHMFYTNENSPYEVGILKDGSLTYETHITSDVLGYQTEQEVTEVMKKVQELT